MLIIEILDIYTIEAIVRGYLTGSGLRDYQKTGIVCGHQLPAGLHDGSKLPEIIFTPSTKEDEGHDQNIEASSVDQELGQFAIQVYKVAMEYALYNGIILVDTKFEFGHKGDRKLVIADEVLTPDSSRYWSVDEWTEADKLGKAPSGFDKEPVRQWGLTVPTPSGLGINTMKDTMDSANLDFVASLVVPSEVVSETTVRYRTIFELLTGDKLETYQREEMGIDI